MPCAHPVRPSLHTFAGCEMLSHVWQLKSGLPLSMMALKMSSSYTCQQATVKCQSFALPSPSDSNFLNAVTILGLHSELAYGMSGPKAALANYCARLGKLAKTLRSLQHLNKDWCIQPWLSVGSDRSVEACFLAASASSYLSMVKGRPAAQQDVQDDPHSPHISPLIIVLLQHTTISVQHHGRHVNSMI